MDSAGQAYVAGHIQGGGAEVRKLNSTGTAFLYSASIRGSGREFASGIAIDAQGSVYVAGSTTSTDFPTTAGAFKQSGPGSLGTTGIGAFVTKLGPTGTPAYSTLLAGDRGEEAFGIAVDVAGHAYVTGYTLSSNFPTTPGAFQTARRGGQDAFVTKLKPDGSGLAYSTLLGGPGGGASSTGRGIAVDGTGSAHVTGATGAGEFPTTPDALQPPLGTGQGSDVFLTKLNASGSALLYSTYLGGADFIGQVDEGHAIALDLIGDAYITGRTNASVDFPTTPGGFFTPFQRLNAGGSDAFGAKFSTGTPTVFSISTILPSAGGDTGTVSAVIHGTVIAQGATVKLTRPGQEDILGDPVAAAADGRTVSATFNLLGKARGAWDVVVTNPSGASITLPGAFLIEEGRAAQVWVDIVGRNTAFVGRPQTFYILIGNRSNTDMNGTPLVRVTPRDGDIEVPVPPSFAGAEALWNRLLLPLATAEEVGALLPAMAVPPGTTEVVRIWLTVHTIEAFTIRAEWNGR